MSLRISKATGDVSPSLPERLGDSEENTQTRDIHLFAFNLRLEFPPLDSGELHSNLRDWVRVVEECLLPARYSAYKSRASREYLGPNTVSSVIKAAQISEGGG